VQAFSVVMQLLADGPWGAAHRSGPILVNPMSGSKIICGSFQVPTEHKTSSSGTRPGRKALLTLVQHFDLVTLAWGVVVLWLCAAPRCVQAEVLTRDTLLTPLKYLVLTCVRTLMVLRLNWNSHSIFAAHRKSGDRVNHAFRFMDIVAIKGAADFLS